MISVMNNTTDLELDRKSDESRRKSRGREEDEEDAAGVDASNDRSCGESSYLSAGSSEDDTVRDLDFEDERGGVTVRMELGSEKAPDSDYSTDMEMESAAVVVKDGQSRVGKGHSEYDSMISMFDEFAANGGMAEEGSAKRPLGSGYGYQVGDMVWGKVKSHPWWPGHIYSEEFASPSVRRLKRDGHVLVAFYGDSSYGWFDPAELIPFDSNFEDKSRQTTSRTFVKAVEEAVDEASRRRALGLSCMCRSKFNFRSTEVRGYFSVDVLDYEPGAVYSSAQIKKCRDSFKPRDTVSFIKQLAMSPALGADNGLDFIKNKATVLAYRKATYEAFDDTYAQAFGYQPIPPTPGSAKELPPGRMPARAPLSGRLVIAETLGKGKGSAKLHKAKDQAKKDKYLFKRRDESRDLKIEKMNEAQSTSSPQPVYVEGSVAGGAGDYVLQKRIPAKPLIPAQHEQTAALGKNVISSFGDETGKVAHMEGTPGVVRYSTKVEPSSEAPPGYSGHPLAVRLSVDKEEHSLRAKEEIESVVAVGVRRLPSSSLEDDKPAGDAVINNLVEGFEQPVEMHREKQGQVDVCDSGLKKVMKAQKRPIVELSAEKSVFVEKKKRKKELFMRERDGGTVARKVAAKPAEVASAPKPPMENHPQSLTDVGTRTASFTDNVFLQQISGFGNTELELPQLLSDLQSLALDPFHGIERNTPAITRQVFLRFRGLVYQKSLALSPPREDEAYETPRVNRTASDNAVAQNAREIPQSVKPQVRPSVRLDDPTRGGRKRLPSDRQEEIVAKKKKKVNDIRNLTAEKKVVQKNLEAATRDGNNQSFTTMAAKKVIGSESSVKKTEQQQVPPSRSASQQPTMLVMKFPSGGSLPSINELKARFARFGPMDHTATRIFWKTFTCRLVYRNKASAQAAYKFVVGGNPFGNTDVKCHLREVEEPEPAIKDAGLSSGGSQQAAAAGSATQLKSCLKKSNNGEEEARGNGTNGNRGTSRVKFMLGGEENNSTWVGEQLPLAMIGNKNNFNNNNATSSSFADVGSSSSSSPSPHLHLHHHASMTMDFNSKNFQKAVLTNHPPLPIPPLPIPIPTSVVPPQFIARQPPPQNLMHYKAEVVAQTPPPPPPLPRNVVIAPNFNAPLTSHLPTPNVDISQQMLSLLTKCNDVVTTVTTLLGYVPYHPL